MGRWNGVETSGGTRAVFNIQTRNDGVLYSYLMLATMKRTKRERPGRNKKKMPDKGGIEVKMEGEYCREELRESRAHT
jgi:hypothetical protein